MVDKDIIDELWDNIIDLIDSRIKQAKEELELIENNKSIVETKWVNGFIAGLNTVKNNLKNAIEKTNYVLGHNCEEPWDCWECTNVN